MTPPSAQDADATQQIKLLTRGMNVGILDGTPEESSWTGQMLHGWYFEAIKEAGFDNVAFQSGGTFTRRIPPQIILLTRHYSRVSTGQLRAL